MTQEVQAERGEFCYVIGVDVGGTNTDACILRRRRKFKEQNKESETEKVVIVCSKKATTTKDVTTGIVTAISSCLEVEKREMEEIDAVMIGTTRM
jgi:N-methylhydantoinase A/oxoprolinase/acetone carboxylase beta subunit